MQRPIKFRVWTGNTMEYRIVAGQLGAFYVEGMDPKDSACLSPFNTIYSPETPIMQFTGLKDKNGKEIYEGDILKLAAYCHQPARVEYRGCRWKLVYPDGNSWGNLDDEWHKTQPEIIGNIYEKAQA